MTIFEGINIWSGSKDPIGAALTNPTHFCVRKGTLERDYPLVDKHGRQWRNVEFLYKAYRTGDLARDMQIMVRAIALKLRTYPELGRAINRRGGAAWLEQCSHYTGARSSRWEGQGRKSAFILCLVKAYEITEAPDGVKA